MMIAISLMVIFFLLYYTAVSWRKLKRIEYTIRSQKHISALLNAISSIIWLADENGNPYANLDGWMKFHNATEKEIIHGGWLNFIHPDDKEKVQNEFAKGIKSKETIRGSCRIKQHDGEWIWMSVCIVPVLDQNGFAKEWIGSAQNIHETIKLENRLLVKESALDSSLNSIILTNVDGVIYYVNDALLSLLKCKREDVIGKLPRNFLANPDEATPILLEAKMKGSAQKEFSLRNFYGDIITVLTNVTLVKDIQGHTFNIMLALIDITEQKKMFDKVLQSERLLKASQKMAKIGSWQMNIQTKIAERSEELFRIFEIDNYDQLNYNPFLMRVHPDDRERVDAIYKNSLINKLPYTIKHRLLFDDGRIKYVEERGKTDFNEQGEAVFSYGTVQDITNSKQIENAKNAAENRFTIMLNLSPFSVVIRDPKTILPILFNDKALQLFGYSAEEFKQLTIKDLFLFDSENKHTDEDRMVEILENNQLQFELKAIRKNQELIDVEVTIFKVELNDKHVVCSIYNDITERKKAQLKLEQQNQELKKVNNELDRFVYSTSHDLRAPLMTMLGLINVIENQVDNQNNMVLDCMSMMKNTVHNLDHFINEILDYSRNSRIEVQYENIHFMEIINEINQRLKFYNHNNFYHFHANIEEEIPFVSDKIRIKVILNNLLSNAIKYLDKNKAHSEIFLNIRTTNEEVIIIVSDNGVGIEDKFKEKIFEMFYRGTSLSTGNGLGLYILKESVDTLKGAITLDSSLGKGATFTIYLPNNNH